MDLLRTMSGKDKKPKHSRGQVSCKHCRKTKVRCPPSDIEGVCARCQRSNRTCEWSKGGSNPKSCERCKQAKSHCERSEGDMYGGACISCIEAREHCSVAWSASYLDNDQPYGSSSAPQPVAGPSTLGSYHADPAPPAAQQSVAHGRLQPVLHVEAEAAMDTRDHSPVASSPRSFWSVVLESDPEQN